MIFVTHEIGAAIEIGDQMAVMYGGTIVEKTDIHHFIHQPLHPYSHGLLASNVNPEHKGKRLPSIVGSPPTLQKDSIGCSFAPRCTSVIDKCLIDRPIPQWIEGTQISCWEPMHAKILPMDKII